MNANFIFQSPRYRHLTHFLYSPLCLVPGYDSHISGSEQLQGLNVQVPRTSSTCMKSPRSIILTINDYLRWNLVHRFLLFQNSAANLQLYPYSKQHQCHHSLTSKLFQNLVLNLTVLFPLCACTPPCIFAFSSPFTAYSCAPYLQIQAGTD